MELSTLLPFIGIIACPIAMGLMMWWMNKQMNEQQGQTSTGKETPAERLAALRQQRQASEAEIAELTRLVELEVQKEAMLSSLEAGKPVINHR